MGVVVFVVYSVGLFAVLAKIPHNSYFFSYHANPEDFFFWFGLVGSACLALIIPGTVMVKLYKLFSKEKTKEAEKEKKASSWRDFKVKY